MGNIIENNLKEETSWVWDKIPTLADKSCLNFDLKEYNKSFVNLAVAVGVIVVAKSAFKITQTSIKSLSLNKKLLPASQLQQKYGPCSWALIADCKNNEEYAKFLAKNGFNLVLMGEEGDVEIAKEQSQSLNGGIKIETIIVDWKREEKNLKFYEDLLQELKNIDISILVLPKIIKPKEHVPSHIEHVHPFTHLYLLTRYFAEKLTWRSYISAIVFPSYPQHQDISSENGITKSIIAGMDAFGRIIGHEQEKNFEVVVARGSVENAFIGLGKERITY